MAWQDHAVIVVYLASMIALGIYLARRQHSGDEYFLAGRSMPWFAVGVSVIASLLSSLTYLSEPGEVWKSGVTHVFGKMLAIPVEMVIVWIFCVPFMMRFRYTSAYEYLGDRFGKNARLLGVILFIAMVVLWMGFVVNLSAKALATVSGLPLVVVIATVGIVATIYTMLGGLRAVIWTDVIQVLLLIGGGVYTILYVGFDTGTWLPTWYETAVAHLESSEKPHSLPWLSFDPFMRATVVTVALNMCIWHVCTHIANQMTVQRYFSTSDVTAARRSFVTASLFSVGLNLMLVGVGLAVLYYYVGQSLPLDGGLDPNKDHSLIFPTFAVSRLPAGLGGAILAALLAAAMSSIDSGINAVATVVSVEQRKRQGTGQSKDDVVASARVITAVAGLFIMIAAYGLTFLPDSWGVVAAMPRTFNAITGPIGGLFLVGMFLPRVGERAAISGTICGMITSISMGYYEQIGTALHGWGVTSAAPTMPLSFTLIMPASLLVTFAVAFAISLLAPQSPPAAGGLTWASRAEKPSSE